MTEPGRSSRVGFRLMAAAMSFTRRGAILAQRLRRAGVTEGRIVLDYACGPGYYTVEAARIVGPSGHVYAVDIQPAAAAMVSDRAVKAGLDNVTAITSGLDTGLPSASVDLVLLFDAIAGIVDKRGVLAELDRVLKPQGPLAVWVEHGDPGLTRPLITEHSRFTLRTRDGDILVFIR